MPLISDPATLTLRIYAPAPPDPPPPPPPGYPEGYVPVDPAGPVTVEFGAFTATIADVIGYGFYADGMPYVHVAGPATLTAKTPPVETEGRIRHGFMLNPFREQGGQGFDSDNGGAGTWKPGWSPARLPAIPTPLEDGDVLLFGIAALTTGNTQHPWRDGFLEQQAWLHVRSTLPPSGAFSPPVFWPVEEKRERPTLPVDLDTVLGWLPSLSTAGMTRPVTWAQLKTYIARPAATFAASAGVNQAGYEPWSPRGCSLVATTNYDANRAQAIELAMMGLIGNNWSTADKRECLIAFLQHGCQWAEALFRYGGRWVPDGSHRQSVFGIAVLWWIASGQAWKLRHAFDALVQGNLPGQYFYMTEDLLARIEGPHSDQYRPGFSRRRTLTSVSGNTVESLNLSGEGANFSAAGLIMRRESDGAEATVLSNSFPSINNIIYSRFVLAEQPTPPFAVGDVVYCRMPFTIVPPGEPEWSVKGTSVIAYYSPAHNTGYRALTAAEPQVLFLTALQILPMVSTVPAMADYVERVAAQTYPTATPPYRFPRSINTTYNLPLYGNGADWANHWPVQMWNTHYAGLKPNASARAALPAFAATEADHLVNLNAAGVLFQERTGEAATTPAAVGDPVGSIRNLGARGGWWTAPADNRRPILRETNGKKWLEFDGIDDIIDYRRAVMAMYGAGYHVFVAWAELSGNPTTGASAFSILANNGSSDTWVQTGFSSATNLYGWSHRGVGISAPGSGLAGPAVTEFRIAPDRTMSLIVNGTVAATGTATDHLNTASRLVFGGRAINFGYQGYSKFALYGWAVHHCSTLAEADQDTIRAALAASLP